MSGFEKWQAISLLQEFEKLAEGVIGNKLALWQAFIY
jgi:hypothetical protein